MRFSPVFLPLKGLIDVAGQLVLLLFRQFCSSAEPSAFFLYQFHLAYIFDFVLKRGKFPKGNFCLIDLLKDISQNFVVAFNGWEGSVVFMAFQDLADELLVALSHQAFLLFR